MVDDQGEYNFINDNESDDGDDTIIEYCDDEEELLPTDDVTDTDNML